MRTRLARFLRLRRMVRTEQRGMHGRIGFRIGGALMCQYRRFIKSRQADESRDQRKTCCNEQGYGGRLAWHAREEERDERRARCLSQEPGRSEHAAGAAAALLGRGGDHRAVVGLSLIHISEPTRQAEISY